MGSLTVKGVEAIAKPGRHSDGSGLYLSVKESGSKSWILIYQRSGRRREIGLGAFPAVGLAAARKRAMEARQLIADGKDPVAERKRSEGVLFGDVADRYLRERIFPALKNAAHRRQWERSLTDLSTKIRNVPVADITVDHVLSVVRPVWATRWATGKRLRIHLAKALDYARALGFRSGPNPAAWEGNLSAVLPPRPTPGRHHPAIDWRAIPGFVAKLRCRDEPAARLTEFAILTACRRAEALAMRFAEIDRAQAVWIIPAHRTKTGKRSGEPTVIPLSPRAIEIIDEAAMIGDGFDDDFCFPGRRGNPLSEKTLVRMIHRMGFEPGTATPHGFRTAFSTWAHDATSHPHEVIEACLAHAVGTATSRAYNRGDMLQKRRALMEDWAAFCGKNGQV